MDAQAKKTGLLYKVLGVIGLLLVVAVYFTPIWWVALQSHQYPKAMYPKGIRIEFKYNGVYNGCEGVQEREEITTNEGAECLVEMNAINHYIGMYPIVQGLNTDRTRPYPEFYVFDTKKDADGKEIISTETGKAIEKDVTPGALKFLDNIMRGSKYFFVIFALSLLYFILTPKKKNTVFALVAALVPFYFLGVFIFYMYWYGHHLNLHGGGAFSGIKPFMPSIFGEGKVAQFTTVSYPYYGFILGLGAFVTILFSILFKRKYISLNNS